MADSARANPGKTKTLTPDALAQLRKREGLILSRTRVVREMESAQNPRYKVQLKKALAELDAQLENLR